jgi:hypothetical protein
MKWSALLHTPQDEFVWPIDYRQRDFRAGFDDYMTVGSKAITWLISRLGGIVVNVLATGPKGRGFKPRLGDGFLRAIKSPQHIFLRMGSKTGDPMSWNFTEWSIDICQILILKIFTPSSIPRTCSQISLLVGLPESSGGRVRSFPHPALSSSSHDGQLRLKKDDHGLVVW